MKALALDKLNDQVTIKCYGDIEKMTRKEGLEKYFDCMRCSEGPEHQRYETIFFQLLLGYTLCDDKIPFYEI